MEHVLRQSLIALRLAERLGLDEAERRVVYYVGLLAWVGCHVDAYEQAKWFGDDTVFKSDALEVDTGRPLPPATFVLRHLGSGRPLRERAQLGIAFLGDGRRAVEDMIENHWLATNELAAQLGLGREVCESLYQTFERWDGRGVPAEVRGDEIKVTARLVNLADVVEVFHRAGGVQAAIAVARERSGTQFDPALVELFCTEAPALFSELESVASWEAVIAAEPALAVVLSDDEFEAALEAIADLPTSSRRGRSATPAASRPWPMRPRASTGSTTVMPRSCTGPHSCTISGAWVSRTRSGTSRDRSPRPSSNGCACTRI